ncbi:MAG: peptidoglycan editing factor PgeF [Candidatus Methylomirabilales bacterium]
MGLAERGIIENTEPGLLRLPFFERLSIRHAFSTRKGGVSAPPYHTLNLALNVGDDPAAVHTNRRRFLGALGLDLSRVVRVRQVHGNDVLVVGQALAGREGFPRLLLGGDYFYDAMVTNVAGLGLTISTADCLPIFVVDPRRRAIGAVHAGWRSSLSRVLEQALTKLQEVYGTDPADCYAALGPGIRGCCYEVDEPVITPLQRACPRWEACVEPGREGRWMLDLAALNSAILQEVGLRPDRIFDTGLCTACRSDLFFSYRAEKPKTGRMMSLIALL